MLGRKQSIRVGDATLLNSDTSHTSGHDLAGGGGGGGAGASSSSQLVSNAAAAPAASGANLDQFAAAAAAAAGAHGGGILIGATGQAGGVGGGVGAGGAASVAWFNKTSVRHFMRICSIASLISVCANTSRTFSHYPTLVLITFIVDIVSGLVFTIEMVLKIYTRGLMSGPSPYAKDRWCQFDAVMVLFIWISILLQIFEIFHIVEPYSVLSVLRSPRPLILVRFIRVFLKFSMPKSRIKQIFKRSSQQIYNVTLFFMFFMILYGLLGVQLFGQIEKHCVVNGTEPHDITINSLAIPDTHCSGNPNYGNQCPPEMICLDLHLPKEIVGYNGFDHIGHSLYTVYQTSSQEGWSHLMYSTFDHYPAWKVAAYFVSLIFFLGWMVRNVFIAVFTETFNEIRVQFQQMWGERQALASEGVPKILRGDDNGWKLVEIDENQSTSRWVPQAARKFLNSASFQVIVLLAILANVTLSASIKFEHDGRPREQFYMHIYWWEVGFTIFFNIEALFKIACLGFQCYWTRTSHRFELILAIGCTLHIMPRLFMTELADFQVFRVIRLIKASPVLEDFAYKSFGPGRKLGSLVIFTVCLLVVTSAMTMQLFCSLGEYQRFQDFPYAFMSMFQILTQEAWTDVMNETMLRVRDHIGPYVAVYFILYHLFVSLIVLSLFVAVILDNLELPEDLKKAKQEKAREQIACISEELPLRLRVFERFPDSPQMTKLHKSASEFNVPKVRESFMRNFVDDIDNRSTIRNCLRAGIMPKGVDVFSAFNSMPSTGACGGGGGGGGGPYNGLSYQQQQQQHSFAHSGGRAASIKRVAANTLQGRAKSGNNQKSARKQRAAAAMAAAAAASTTLDEDYYDGDNSCYLKPNYLQQQQQHPYYNQLTRLPSLKLLTAASKTSSTSKILRKTTISALIEESNLQRMSLMNEDLALAQRNQLESGGGGGKSTIMSVASGANSGAAGQLRYRGDRSSSLTSKIQQSSYDYLKESGEAGQGENNLRNPQDLNIKMLKRKRQQAELKRSQREKDLRENHPLFDTPLFIVGRESSFRKFCQLLAWAKYQYNDRDPITGKHRKSNYKSIHNLLGLVSYLDWLMIMLTTLSCISMMFETPSMRVMNTPALQVAEYVFVVGMTIELTLKTLANGLVFTPKALLSTTAGLMDSFIFISSLIYALWMPHEVEPQSLAQYLMLLRCVRPLRIFSLIPHMRQVIYELVRGFKAIFLVCILLALLCFVFACYGVHIFGGRLARCTDPTIGARENCTGTFLRKVFVTKMRVPTDDQSYPALLVPRVWANPHRFSFDDIKTAMLTLFEVLSFKGWVDIREALLKRFDNSPHWLYIHIFVFFGCMVGVTLFVGVVIANYGENKGTALLTVDQRRWCDLKKRLKIAQPLHLPPRPDHVRFRAIIYDIIQHILFKRTIAFLVLCNSSLLIVHWNPEGLRTVSFATISAGLTMAFTIEVIMKMIAFTPRGYWQSRRNRYDLVVTLIGCIWALVHFLIFTNNFSNSFGYIVVILRFFTITGKHATLQMLMLTVVVSVYKSFFIILGLFVLVLFYSLLGVQLFGSVKFGENLSRQANFRSAKLGTITMFRIVTGEDWYRMMHDCMIRPPYCTDGKNYWETDCGNFGISFAFFSSFYIIITHMVLNLLVAIIMENFSLFYSSEEDALLSYTDIRNFQNTWNMVDAQQRGSIPVRRVKFILRLLKGRLEVDPTRDQHLIKHMCHEMERLHNGEDVSFHDVLSMLSYRSVDINKSLQFEELLARNELENIIEEEVAKKTIRSWLDQCLRRVKHQRQQNSLIQGLRLTNMSGADLFSLPPPPPPQATAAASSQSTHQSQVSGGGAGTNSKQTSASQQQQHQQHQSSSSGQHSPSAQVASVSSAGGGGELSAAGDFGFGARLASSSTSESQHSLSSAATITTLASNMGRLKRRAEPSRSDSVSGSALGASGAAGGGGVGGTSTTAAAQALGAGTGQQTTSSVGSRKLLATTSDSKKATMDERSQQFRKAFMALTNIPGPVGQRTGSLTQTQTTTQPLTTASAISGTLAAHGGTDSQQQQPSNGQAPVLQQASFEQSLDEESNKLKQQQQLQDQQQQLHYRPKLNAAIDDIHQWWNYQLEL